jgi:hypothetical protein
LLRSLIGDKLGQWDLVVAQVEFTYNNLVNRSIGKIPFQVVYGRSPKGVVDLVKFPEVEDRRSIDVDNFVEKACMTFMSRLERSYNRVMIAISRRNICIGS